jgi:1-acyl-sn-glycerol-3-phosphate acyltransferase
MSLKMIAADRRFAPLFWTQFLGALNDNVFKNALVLMVTYKSITVWGLDEDAIVALSGGLFILPFFLFSHIAGQVADKMEKSRLIRITKYWEVLIMIVAAIGFQTHQFGMLLAVLFLAGVQAALFGPVKYSVLPDLVPPAKLVEANAYVESGTFLAILLGTIAGGSLAALPEYWTTAVLIALAVLGVVSAMFHPAVPGYANDLKIRYNPVPNFISLWKILNRSRAVFNSVLGISWLWFFGAAVLSILPVYCKKMLNGDPAVATCFLAMFTVGVGLGSILCERLSFKRVELGLVPIGSIGMTAFLLDLYFIQPDWDTSQVITLSAFLGSHAGVHLLVDFLLMCVSAGLFCLPLYTLIQERSLPGERSRVIAANNIMNALFMVVSSGMVMAFHAFKLTYPQMFAVLAVLNLLVALYIYTVVPEFTLRFLSWVAARCIYRIRTSGEDHVPKTGPVLLVCNHVSYIDWMIINAMVRRPVHFVMHYKFWGVPVIQQLMTQAGVIPIAGRKENPEVLERAFDRISEALRNDEVVCIFPEGHITRDGKMMEFRPGVEKALAKDPVPVVPMALRGLWGTWFSFGGKGPAIKKVPRHWMSRVELKIGEVVPPQQATAKVLEDKVRRLWEG